MATGPLRFRTPHIEELPTTQTKQAPGFAWIAVSGTQQDPSKSWGTNNRKRARASGAGPTDAQREALSARQQRDIERKIKELNSDNSKDVQIPIPKKEGGGSGSGGASRAGRTANTKKILASGKAFAHYLDDEEAEIARTGKRDGDLEIQASVPQRPSKTPLNRRKAKEDSSLDVTPVPTARGVGTVAPTSRPTTPGGGAAGKPAGEDEENGISSLEAQLAALADAPPLTYNQARSAPPPADAPPPRKFCEVCGFFGRARCMKCGVMTCSVMCKDTHDEHRCLKFYA